MAPCLFLDFSGSKNKLALEFEGIMSLAKALVSPLRVKSGRAHSRDQFAYDRKPLKADVISPRRLVLPRMLPVLSNRGVRPCLTMNQSR
jgi:hypothetical protein